MIHAGRPLGDPRRRWHLAQPVSELLSCRSSPSAWRGGFVGPLADRGSKVVADALSACERPVPILEALVAATAIVEQIPVVT